MIQSIPGFSDMAPVYRRRKGGPFSALGGISVFQTSIPPFYYDVPLMNIPHISTPTYSTLYETILRYC
jgi:hypothetical protein